MKMVGTPCLDVAKQVLENLHLLEFGIVLQANKLSVFLADFLEIVYKAQLVIGNRFFVHR